MIDLKHKIYQLIISRLEGNSLREPSYREKAVNLARKGIGGFIIFGGHKDEVKGFIQSLQSISDIPLFIASDIERGAGQQFTGATSFPSLMAVAAAVDVADASLVELFETYVSAVAEEAIDMGINMPLIPVMDVNLNPENPIICTRSFSDDPQKVAWFGSKYIEILQSAGLISCAKHFPGHGDTSVDSHLSLPVISKTEKDLMETDLIPFFTAVQSGAASIMMGHLKIPSLDAQPAPISRKIVTGLMREKMKFNGLIMTDALNMDALQEIDKVPEKCVAAGVDIILHPADPEITADELEKAVSKGSISEGMIDGAFNRIMRYKSTLKTFGHITPHYKEHADIAEKLFNNSITRVSGSDHISMDDLKRADLVFTGDKGTADISALKEYMPNAVNINTYRGPTGEVVMLALFTTVAAWQGSSGIGDSDRDKINQIIDEADRTIIISFGSPYVLRYFKNADMLIATYDASVYAQKAFFECVKNNRKFQGSLPVQIDFF